MLYTDSDIVTAAALAQIDSEVPAVAAASKPAIVLDGAGGICEQTWSECAQKIQAATQAYTSGIGSGPAAHNQAIQGVGIPAVTRSRVRLNQIVATDNVYGTAQSPLESWMAYWALAIFYRDASSRTKGDRFDAKYTRFVADALTRWRALRASGLPVLYRPLECPGAKHGFRPGTWDASNLSLVSGSGTSVQSVRVAITYYDSSLYVSQVSIGNAESAPSAILTESLVSGKVLQVDITSLSPPTGVDDAVGFSQGILTPLSATHWNVWVGAATGLMYLQNAVGIPIATKTYTLAGDPVLSGFSMGRGQFPTGNIVWQNTINRG